MENKEEVGSSNGKKYGMELDKRFERCKRKKIKRLGEDVVTRPQL